MNKILLLSFILIIIFSTCNLLRKNGNSKILTPEKIENIVSGKDTTQPSLLIFHDKKLPAPDKANQIIIDSFMSNGKNYFTVLAEYPNPVYNRFAIIDDYFNVLLMDKSLSGHLTESLLKLNDTQFIRIEENFISKNTLLLKQVSLYNVDSRGEAFIAFRTYTELKDSNIIYSQEIIKLTPEDIVTKIICSDKSKSEINDSSDNFVFDSGKNKYISKDSKFDSFLINFVSTYTSQSINSSDNQNLLIQETGNSKPDENDLHNFILPLSKQWDEIKNVKISYLLKKLVIGTKFINNQLGAEITVIQLPENDSSENYIKYNLVNISTGNYRVRYSEKVADGIYFYQFFEYSCPSEKFLLILQTLKSTYEIYKTEYQSLINSFSMRC